MDPDQNQQTLFKSKIEPIKSKFKVEKKKEEPIEESAEYDSELEKRINLFVKGCIKEKENYAYLRVWTCTRNTLTEKNEFYLSESVVERPFRDDWDSYGGSWGSNSSIRRENIDGIKNRVITFFRNEMNNPYITSEEKKNLKEHWFRDIKDENIKVFYSGAAMIWLGKENMDAIKLEADKFLGKTVTDEHKKLAIRDSGIDLLLGELNNSINAYRKDIDKMKKDNISYETIEPYIKMEYLGMAKKKELEIEQGQIEEKLRKIIWGES